MFCPKCRYTSFDHLKKCPKCGYDWSDVRKTLNLDWLVPPSESTHIDTGTESSSQATTQGFFEGTEETNSSSKYRGLSGNTPLRPSSNDEQTDRPHFPTKTAEYMGNRDADGEIDSDFLKDNELETLDNVLQPFANNKQGSQDPGQAHPDEASFPDPEGTLVKNNDSTDRPEPTGPGLKTSEDKEAQDNEYLLDFNELEQSLDQSTSTDTEPYDRKNRPGQTETDPKEKQASKDIEDNELDLSSLFNIIDSDPENKNNRS